MNQTVINKVKEIGKNNHIYIIGVILFTYKGFLLNILLEMKIGWEMYAIIAAIPMLILFPCINNTKKRSYIYLNILYFIITILIFANYIYYNYSTNFLSIYQIENLKYGKEIGLALGNLINLQMIFVFFIDNIIVGLFSYCYARKKKIQNQDLLNTKKPKIYKYLFLFFVLVFNLLLISFKIERTYQYFTYNKTLMVQHIGIYYYHLEDVKEYILENVYKEKIDIGNLEEIYKQNIDHKSVDENLTGIANGNNVIILQLESLNEFVINKTVNGEEITPNLNRFFNENIYFSNMYNQGLGTTADSEHTMSTSMYPLENGRVFQKYYNNTWNDIYSVLKQEGYFTSFMHPNVNTFWNRYEVYNSGYKIDEYNDIETFIQNGEFAGEFFSDESFFMQGVEILKSYEEPFVSILVSVSTHIPYGLNGISNLEEKLTLDVSNIEEEEFKNYLLSCNFVDYSFGVLLKELEDIGGFDHTMLVVYGDHGAGLTSKDSIRNLYIENEKEYNEYIEKLQDLHIPFGIKIPGLGKLEVDNVVSKIDIKPTILNLLGINDVFSMGEDVFSGKDYSYIKGMGFLTSDVYYIDGRYIKKDTKEEIVPDASLIFLENKMKDDILLSDTIIRNNLFYRGKKGFLSLEKE